MRTLGRSFAALIVLAILSVSPAPASAPATVAFNDAAAPEEQKAVATATLIPTAHAEEKKVLPKTVSIPSIKLTAPVIPMGINAKGELDVPSGTTNAVGWYAAGVLPGARGSAVMDAHVYAALKNLRNAKVGASIYVTDESGKVIRFVIKESLLYPYDQVPPYYLFLRDDAARLNLITCAGVFDPRIGTYTKRLVVYAVRAE